MATDKTYSVDGTSRIRAEFDIFQLRIKELLAERGKNVKWLADELGLSVSYVTSIMYGTNPTSISRLCDVAKVLKVEFRDLFKETRWMAGCPVESVVSCGESCRSEIDLYDEIISNGGTAIPGNYIVISNPSASEVCEYEYNNGMWMGEYTNRLAKSLAMSVSDMEDVLCGKRSVSPDEWYSMCKILKDKAYCVMPKIHVSVSISKMQNAVFIDEL